MREGIELDVSTLADWVGACTASLAPPTELIRRHVLAAERIHADDTTVPVLAKEKTAIGRLWAYVRDDRPFAGPDPPGRCSSIHATVAASTRTATSPAIPGSSRPTLAPVLGPANGRTRDLRKAPLAIEAVRRIDAIFAMEREINGATAEQRLAFRNERVTLLDAGSPVASTRSEPQQQCAILVIVTRPFRPCCGSSGLTDPDRLRAN
jgi:transposase